MVHQKSFKRMSLTWILLASLLLAPQLFAWVHQGDLIITSQADINVIKSDLKEVTGDLIISGSDIRNLNQLFVLEKVGGSLSIKNTPNLKNLDGLSSLKTVAKNVELDVQVQAPQFIPKRLRQIDQLKNNR